MKRSVVTIIASMLALVAVAQPKLVATEVFIRHPVLMRILLLHCKMRRSWVYMVSSLMSI